MKTKLSLTALLSFIFCLLSSQVPQGFNYQAVARLTTGDPIINTILPVRITIQADSLGTSIIWQELHSSVTTNGFGLMTLVLGKGARQASSTVATFSAIDWSVTPKFIKTEIDYSGWKTMGVTRFWSVPYALKSKDSEQWVTSGTNIYRTTGNVGIGTTTPSFPLEVTAALVRNPSASGYTTLRLYNNLNINNRALEIDYMGSSYASGEQGRVCTTGSYPLWLYAGPGASLLMSHTGKVTIGSGVANTQLLVVQPPLTWADESPLFEVKNKSGVSVLAVYNNGVRILVDHTTGKAVKGGFAVGGYDMTKAGKTVDFMTISPDSIRFNINNDNVKALKGGFAVGGYDVTKGPINQDFMYITPQGSDNGTFNTFLGYQTGLNNTSAYNTFVGYQAGTANSSGTNNVFIGYKAGNTNQIGGNNVFMGTEAGSVLTSGNANVFIGYQAGMRNNGGFDNVIIGHEAGLSSGAGYTNVIIGYRSGYRITNGHTNVFIGQRSGYATTTGQRNTIIGAYAGYNGSDLLKESTGNYNTILGQEAASAWTTGIGNTIVGSNASQTLTTGDNNTIIGRSAGTNSIGAGDNNIVIGYGAQVPTVDGSNQIRMGNTSITYAGIQVAWTITSDIKWKKSIEDLSLGLGFVNKLRPVDYIRKNSDLKTREVGFIAQDVQKLLGYLKIENAGLLSTGSDGSLELRYNDFIPILTKAIQEQQQQIESQNQKIDRLEKMISEMEGRIASSR